MRRTHRTSLIATLVLVAGCAGTPADKVEVPGKEGALKTTATARAERRAYDGAPPVIPHEDLGIDCVACHTEGMEVEDLGYAPPAPHGDLEGAVARCRQCHVFAASEQVFVANAFVGMRQDLRRGKRLNPISPPTIPHKTFMRENCVSCHSGPAAREEIRTSHPERVRCRQCHVPVTTLAEFRP